MDNIHLLRMYESDRSNMLMVIIQSLKDRLSVPGSFLAFRGYTPSFNDGSPCTHTWDYVGFGPGWIDRDYFITVDREVLNRWDDKNQLDELGVPMDGEPTEDDSALVTLVVIFWADIGRLIQDEQRQEEEKTIEAAHRYFMKTNCEGVFYLDEEGKLWVDQDDYYVE